MNCKPCQWFYFIYYYLPGLFVVFYFTEYLISTRLQRISLMDKMYSSNTRHFKEHLHYRLSIISIFVYLLLVILFRTENKKKSCVVIVILKSKYVYYTFSNNKEIYYYTDLLPT